MRDGSSQRRRRRLAFAAALLIVALALRLALVAATPEFQPRLDSEHYDGLACGLVLGEGYALRTPAGRTPDDCGKPAAPPNPPTAFRPPAWPVTLAATYAALGDHDRWVKARIVQALIGVLAAALIGLLARLLLGPQAGLVALAVGALDTTLIAVGGSLLSEPQFVALITAALCAAALAREPRRRTLALVAAGVLAGLATLTRTNGIVLVPVLALLAVPLRRGHLRETAAALAVVAVAAVAIVAPWTIRNAIQLHAPVPVATYFGTGLAGTFNEQARTRTDFPGAWISPRHVRAFADIHHSTLNEVERQRELQRRALEHAREHPGYVVTSAVRNALRMLGLVDRDWARGNAHALSLPDGIGPPAAYGFWVVLALGLLGFRRIPRALPLAAVLLVASAVWFGGEMRYRAPLVPLLAVGAAAAVTRARTTVESPQPAADGAGALPAPEPTGS